MYVRIKFKPSQKDTHIFFLTWKWSLVCWLPDRQNAPLCIAEMLRGFGCFSAKSRFVLCRVPQTSQFHRLGSSLSLESSSEHEEDGFLFIRMSCWAFYQIPNQFQPQV